MVYDAALLVQEKGNLIIAENPGNNIAVSIETAGYDSHIPPAMPPVPDQCDYFAGQGFDLAAPVNRRSQPQRRHTALVWFNRVVLQLPLQVSQVRTVFEARRRPSIENHLLHGYRPGQRSLLQVLAGQGRGIEGIQLVQLLPGKAIPVQAGSHRYTFAQLKEPLQHLIFLGSEAVKAVHPDFSPL